MTVERPDAARLRQLLAEVLGDNPLGELLPLAVAWRVTNGRVLALARNQAWEEVLREQASEALGQWCKERSLEFEIVCLAEDAELARPAGLSGVLADPGNEFALTACRRALEAPGLVHNPLYLHGGRGCGKSHLLAALAAEFRGVIEADQVLELDGAAWAAGQARELAERGSSPLRERVEHAAVVIFDRVEQLAGRRLAQEQLFHLINEALDRGVQLVLAGAAAPRRLGDIEDRLQTRLGWGLAVAIEMPLIETRAALLRQLAGDALDGHPDADIMKMVEALAPDLHQVAALAARLRSGERVRIGQEQASFDRIIEVVAERFALLPQEIAGKRRSREVALARQTALLLGRRLTGHSLQALGGMLGGRDHSTVMYSIRQAEERSQADASYARDLSELTQAVLQR